MASTTTDLIRQRMQEHRDTVEAIRQRRAPMMEERAAVHAEQERLRLQDEELTRQIRADDSELIAAKEGISACATALGAIRLSDG